MGDSADNDPELIRKFKEEYSVEEEGIFRVSSYGLTNDVKSGLQFVDVSDKDFNGYSPLHWACRNGKVDTLNILVEAKADIEAPSNNGVRPLHLACNTIREILVKRLIELKGDVNAGDALGNTPLHWAARRGVNLTIIPLIEANGDLEARNDAGMTPLAEACRGMSPCVATLIRLKGDISTQDKEGNTLLHYGAALDSIDICKILLGAKVDPAVANRNGQIARDLITNTNLDLVELFDGPSDDK